MARSRRRWGWHEITETWAERLVEHAHVTPRHLVVDIGAGNGQVTSALLEHGVRRVVAVELHGGRADVLRRRFAGDDRVVVVRTDAGDLRLPRRPFHVVANLPFSVTSPVLRRLLHRGSRMRSATVILQDEAARRWEGPTAPGHPRWSADFVAMRGPSVPRTAFRPPPRVNMRILRIDRRA